MKHVQALLEPWIAVEDCDGLEKELIREVPRGHVLRGRRCRAVARHCHEDDVLFALEDGRHAVVHLTWKVEKDPEWPWTTLYADRDAWVEECMKPDHAEMDNQLG